MRSFLRSGLEVTPACSQHYFLFPELRLIRWRKGPIKELSERRIKRGMTPFSKQIEQSYETQIDELVGSVFRTMLEADVATSAQAHPDPAVTALIAFGGNWSGGFELRLDYQSAVALARAFLQTDDMNEFNDDVRDAIGELANVIAGNLKAILPLGTTLGAPSIVEGKDYAIRICGQHVVGSTSFASSLGSFDIRLVEDLKTNERVQ
jgi:chemotaxis protein CheX